MQTVFSETYPIPWVKWYRGHYGVPFVQGTKGWDGQLGQGWDTP